MIPEQMLKFLAESRIEPSLINRGFKMRIADVEKDKAVFTTEYVMNHNSDIIYISIDDDLDLQVFSSEGADMDKAMLVSMANILAIDDSILLLPEFERGDKFIRKDRFAPWQKL